MYKTIVFSFGRSKSKTMKYSPADNKRIPCIMKFIQYLISNNETFDFKSHILISCSMKYSHFD